MMLFVAIFIASTTNNRIKTSLKISKHSNYGSQIETFELTTVEYRRMKKLDSETKFELHDEQYVHGTQKFIRFR